LSTTTLTLDEAATGLDVLMRVDRPTAPGTYPVVVYQHGFLLDVDWTSTLLAQVASHGVVVVAAQMYAANNVPLGKPTTIEEAADAAAVLAFVAADLEAALGDVVIDGAPVLAGHSRGAKVLWRVLTDDVTAGRGLVLLDPVDGAPSADDPAAVDGSLAFGGPSIVLGLGLSTEGRQACAPAEDGHARFAPALPGTTHVVADDGGHLDLLDDEPPGCFFVCTACAVSSAPAAVRAMSAGFIVATVLAADGDEDAIAVAVARAPVALRRP